MAGRKASRARLAGGRTTSVGSGWSVVQASPAGTDAPLGPGRSRMEICRNHELSMRQHVQAGKAAKELLPNRAKQRQKFVESGRGAEGAAFGRWKRVYLFNAAVPHCHAGDWTESSLTNVPTGPRHPREDARGRLRPGRCGTRRAALGGAVAYGLLGCK